MRQLREKARRVKLRIRLAITFMVEAYHFFKVTMKYNASVNTDNDIEKMQYTMLRENHTIEKGLSMRNPKKGFGQQKVTNLLNRLDKYMTIYYQHDSAFMDYPLSTISNYIQYTKSNGIDIPAIEKMYNQTVMRLKDGKYNHIPSGIFPETKAHILDKCNSDFESLLYSRHSLRYFISDIVSTDDLEKALRLAQRTPSACNRQGWKTHVFLNDKCHELLEWQGGCRGFERDIHTAILVTANLKAFLSYEVFQAYVDGGLYAMNLINALHSMGIGTIPLSLAFQTSKLQTLQAFGIPENEVPILIIGVGYLPENFNVAVSDRKPIEKTNTFHINE